MSETGISINGRKAIIQFLKKRNMIRTTRLMAIINVSATSLTDCLTKIDLSRSIFNSIPGGALSFICANRT